jgi:ABC-type amino acid transport substrate-binding protein
LNLLASAAIGLGSIGLGSNPPAMANDTLTRAAADPNNWAMYGRDYDNTRYSPLKGITTDNAGQIKFAFAFQLGSLRSNESTPIVVGDMLYVSTSWGQKYVHALNAATGKRIWTYEVEIPDDVLQYACCDVNNRGVTYADGKIFVGQLDGKLAALDAKTGQELWIANVVDYKQGSVITSPPLVVKNLLITGFGGGEYGARGSLQAYDINTGKQVWKTWTVPGPGEAGNDTWKGDSWQHGGGVPWLIGSYDAKTNTVFYGTSNPSPWNSAVRSTGNSNYGNLRNLYTSSTLALDADTEAEDAMRALADGKVDAAFVWGPIAGYVNKTVFNSAFTVTPVRGPGLAWPAAIGLARDHAALRDKLNRAIEVKRAWIDELVAKYGFPSGHNDGARWGEARGGGQRRRRPARYSNRCFGRARERWGASDKPKSAIGSDTGAPARRRFSGRARGLQRHLCSLPRSRCDPGRAPHQFAAPQAPLWGEMDEKFHYTVTHGRPDKGMPNWTGVLTEEQFDNILAFLRTVQVD